MKVIVIPDIHLKPYIFRWAENIMKEHNIDQAVCLMDIADDWGKQWQLDMYKETYNAAIMFAQNHRNTLWCWGNHDVSYVIGMKESGYSVIAPYTVTQKIEELKYIVNNKSKFQYVHKIDNVIFAHGGLTQEYVDSLNLSYDTSDTDRVIKYINKKSMMNMWHDASPLWARPQYESLTPYNGDKYIHVVGHTPVDMIKEENGFISTDVFSTDDKGKPIGRRGFLIIDTISKRYEIASVIE